ncbi:MAG: hypothetical protein E8D48_12050 [Nitrospira sp.]|nr:MAG: hypothetical protein E8D48_12050 [Nitrospira sp.]
MPDFPERSTSTPPYPNGNLEELQELLFAAERKRLNDLEDRLKNSVVEATAERKRLDQLEGDLNQLDDHVKNKIIDASVVANVLPDAISQRTNRDSYLKESLAPIITQTLAYAVQEDPRPVVNAISPVMGPAIRKYIDDALQSMVRKLDLNGLSWRGMTWHWEAWRTGKSFAEVALSHTMKYEVQRVFLFFKEDGVHLGDVHRPGIPPFEPGHEDLISSMFSSIKTAVQKFAQDEFQASEHASMEEFKIGDDLTVLIEHGPKAVLAAVVHGLPLPSLRTSFQNALDTIHIELNEALQTFQGDKKAFEAARPYLGSCLLHEESDFKNETSSARGGLSPALVAFLMLSVIWLIWWSVTSYVERQRWADFLDKASEIPGIHITSITANGKNGKTTVYGLRDPLSDNPQEIAREAGLPHEAIDFQLEPYLSLQPELVARRAKDILHPPESVRLSVPNGTTVLNIAGAAPHAWIAQIPKIGSMIPGVTSIHDAELQDESRRRLDQLVREIETHQFDFEAGSASLSAESEAALQAVLLAFRESDALAQQLGNRMRVEIRGNTSEEGSVETNRRLALARAQRIQSALNLERFQAIDLLPVADSVEPSAIGEFRDLKPQRARRVSFHVTVNDFGSRGSIP